MTGSHSPPGASATDPAPADGPTTHTALPDRVRRDTSLPAIPGYRVVRRLGGGGMGDVYEVIDLRLDERFALKVIRPDRPDPAFRERFLQEVKAMLLLHHPHVARFYKYDEVGGCPFFTMDFFPGGTLADRRGEFRADPRAAARLLAKVADATDYLHRRGKVHRDLKPSNILFTAAGEPVVGDFGLVKDVADLASAAPMPAAPAGSTPVGATDETRTAAPAGVTRTGGIVGTAAYMSPEQARGDRSAVGPAADVWALGVILYELVVGHRPADADDPADPLPELARLDPELARVVGRCLAEDPGARYTSAAELAADLRRWADPAAAPPAPARPRSAWRFAPALALLIGSAVLVSFAVRPPGSDRPPTLEEARQAVRAQLKAGKAVTLIDSDGNAQPVVRLIVGEAMSKAGRDPGGWWGLNTPDVALAEFLDDPGVPAVTVSARVRGEITPVGLPTAGLYVAHRRVAGPAGAWDFQLESGFREYTGNCLPPGAGGAPAPAPAPAQPGAKFSLRPKKVTRIGPPDGERFVRLRGRAVAANGEVPVPLAPPQEIARDRPTEGGPWRALEIRIDGATFATTWDGNPEGKPRPIRDEEVGRVQQSLQPPPDPPLTFTARGGLGVFAAGGSVAVRDLKVVPRTAP